MVTNFANVPSILADLNRMISRSGGLIGVPAYKMFAKNKPSDVSPRIQWNRINISSGFDELAAQLTSSATSATIVGSSANNFLLYVPGNTYIQFDDGDTRLVTAIDGAGTTLTLQNNFAGSTAATQASGNRFKVGYLNPTGIPLQGRNDVQFSSTDYNYISNFQLEVPLDYLNSQGRFKRFTDENEASFGFQEELLELMVIKQIEWEFWNGLRYTQGDTSASVGLLGTNAPKGGISKTGGYFQYNTLHGGLIDNLAGAPITEPRLRAQIRRLRLRNAFDDVRAFSESHTAQCYLVCSFETGSVIQQITDNLRLRTDEVVKSHGTDIQTINIEGVTLQIIRSIGMPKTKYALFGNKAKFAIDLIRFMEANKETYSGDQIVRPYENTWGNKFGNCFPCMEVRNVQLPDDIVAP